MKPSEDTLPDLSRDFLSFQENLTDARNEEAVAADLDLSDCGEDDLATPKRDEGEEDAMAFRRMSCSKKHELRGFIRESLSAIHSDSEAGSGSSESDGPQSQWYSGRYLEPQEHTSDDSAFASYACSGEAEMNMFHLADKEEDTDMKEVTKCARVGCLDGENMGKLLLDAGVLSPDQQEKDLSSIARADVVDPFQRMYCLDEEAMNIVYFEAVRAGSSGIEQAADTTDAACRVARTSVTEACAPLPQEKNAAAMDGNGPPNGGNGPWQLDTIEEASSSASGSETSEIIDWCLDLVDKFEEEERRVEASNSADVCPFRTRCLEEGEMTYFSVKAGVSSSEASAALQVDEEQEDNPNALTCTDAAFMRSPCLDENEMKKFLSEAGVTPSLPAEVAGYMTGSNQQDGDDTGSSNTAASSSGDQWWYRDAGVPSGGGSWSAKFLKRRFRS
jgi:hypothetical protein